MKSFKILCLALLVCAAGVRSADAQELQGRWGVGGFIAYNIPMYAFGERWDGSTDKWGFNLNYVSSSRLTMEVEYHNAKLDNGVLETQSFTWGPTGKDYASGDLNADSSYEMKFNSLLLSGIIWPPRTTSCGRVRRRVTQKRRVEVWMPMATKFPQS